VRSIVIDGEAVVCGKDGKSEFDKLHSGTHDAAVFLFAFDLIELDGEDIRPAPLEQRKGKLEKLLARNALAEREEARSSRNDHPRGLNAVLTCFSVNLFRNLCPSCCHFLQYFSFVRRLYESH
jgi:ATP-dependent DNA ligase